MIDCLNLAQPVFELKKLLWFMKIAKELIHTYICLIFSLGLWMSVVAAVFAMGLMLAIIYQMYLKMRHPNLIPSKNKKLLDFVNVRYFFILKWYNSSKCSLLFTLWMFKFMRAFQSSVVELKSQRERRPGEERNEWHSCFLDLTQRP